KSGSRASPSSRTMAISLPTLRKPCGAITPNSARCPRKAFTTPVRWRTSHSRPRCSSTAACWSAVLTGTKRIVGRPTASRFATPSRVRWLSFLALDVRLQFSRGHERPPAPQPPPPPPQVVRRRPPPHPTERGGRSTKDPQPPPPPKFLAKTRRSLCIDPVH